jgi:hypothetical protein
MSDRIIPVLSISCGALTTIYMSLMVMTICFASYQTAGTSSLRTTEGQIGNLEANYYTALTKISTMNPTTLGFVEPSQVEYVAASQNNSVGLTFAGN